MPSPRNPEIEERVFLGRHIAFALLHQRFHYGKRPIVFFFGGDDAGRRLRQQPPVTLQVDGCV
jgi:hypothetical protein